MRIRHLVLTRSFAGVERHVCVLASEQARQGHHVEVWGGLPSSMKAALDQRVVHRPARRVLPTAVQARATSSPDVVHAHMTSAETAALASRALRHVPVVTTRHFAAVRGATRGGRAVRGVVGRGVDAQIAISRYVAEHIDGDATVVYPGVEPAGRIPGPRRRVVLVVQRLQPEKRTEVAVRAFAAGAPKDWTLEVVGRGPERGALETLARDLGIVERTAFLGFRQDVPDLMTSASVLLAPCEVEGLGLSVLEAMSHGLPVLASRAGAHPETVGLAQDAQLFWPGDVDDAAARLAALCGDDGLRSRYGGQLAQEQREHFTPSTQAIETETVYLRVLE